MKVSVDKALMDAIDVSEINSLALRSDLENNNIYGTVLRAEGYVGNAPEGQEGSHEDDTWAIDCLTEDGFVVDSYLYTSELEYDEDVELLDLIGFD